MQIHVHFNVVQFTITSKKNSKTPWGLSWQSTTKRYPSFL